MTQGKETIMYSFFSKPISSPLTMLRRSAMTESTKVATTASEILRRWTCTSENLSGSRFEKITAKYMDNLAAPAYPP